MSVDAPSAGVHAPSTSSLILTSEGSPRWRSTSVDAPPAGLPACGTSSAILTSEGSLRWRLDSPSVVVWARAQSGPFFAAFF
eukprot:scaffold5680_cov122-Isochrysis_galbana.AAC.2